MGRPKKYATEAEASAAHSAVKRQHKQRKRQLENQNQPRFVTYMPVPSDVPSITPPNLLLRSNYVGPSTAPTAPTTPTAQTLQGDHTKGGPASATEQLQPLPLPLPLPLQPPAFHLREEEDEVQKQQ